MGLVFFLLSVDGLQVFNLQLQVGLKAFLMVTIFSFLDFSTHLGNLCQGHGTLFRVRRGVVLLLVQRVLLSSRDKSSDVASTIGTRLVSTSQSSTFFGSANVNFILLESSNGLVKSSKGPGTRADTSGFKEEANAKQSIGDGVAQEGKREGTSHQLPGNGGNNGGDQGSKKTSFEELLGTITNSKNIVFIIFNVNSGDTGNDKEARNNAQLTSNHESRKTTSTVSKEEVTGPSGPRVGITFGFSDLGHSKEGNLHTLQHTNNRHQTKEEDDGNSRWNTFPHGGLAIKQGRQSDSEGKDKEGNREENLSPVAKVAKSITGRLVGFDRLAGHHGDNHLDQVGSMQETRCFNSHSNPNSEGGKVVVQVVKHAVGSIDLGVQLTNHACEKNHGKTGFEEAVGKRSGKVQDISIRNGSSRHVDNKNQGQHHELTAHQVTVQVVALVSAFANLGGNGVGFTVEFNVNGRKTHHGSLGSFHHGQPNQGTPQRNGRQSRVHIFRQVGLFIYDQSMDHNEREDQEQNRDKLLDKGKGILFHTGHGCLFVVEWFGLTTRKRATRECFERKFVS
mmetsp:Transcript_15560/g.35617  ORF Transcript_15560/g.35617 Transcript_15560/m.35617 type:complete len:563 (+) Transcript_15560:176-1864(+)